MVKFGIFSSILLAYPPPQPYPRPTPGPGPGPEYQRPPPPKRAPPPAQQPPAPAGGKKKGPMVLTVLGIVLLIVGLILMIGMWPFVGGMGVYENMDDLPEEPEEDQTYTIMGTVDQAHTEGDYTLMVIEFNDGKMGWVEEGSFSEGETVLFNVKCNDKDDWEDAGVGDDEEDDTDWDEWFESGKEVSEDELELYHDMVEESMEENGLEIEVVKPPMIGGIIGLILLIVGLILLIIGLMKRSKANKTPPPMSPQ